MFDERDGSFEVKVDGSSYEVKIHTERENEDVVYSFSTDLDEKNYKFSSEISTKLIEDLRIEGFDVHEELNTILEQEIKLEISRYYDGPYWNNRIGKKGNKE